MASKYATTSEAADRLRVSARQIRNADEMAAAYYMEEDPSGNVTLREVEFEDALSLEVPIAAIALDLAESLATREHSAGRSVLKGLLPRG